jgi:hypothetical protein
MYTIQLTADTEITFSAFNYLTQETTERTKYYKRGERIQVITKQINEINEKYMFKISTGEVFYISWNEFKFLLAPIQLKLLIEKQKDKNYKVTAHEPYGIKIAKIERLGDKMIIHDFDREYTILLGVSDCYLQGNLITIHHTSFMSYIPNKIMELHLIHDYKFSHAI